MGVMELQDLVLRVEQTVRARRPGLMLSAKVHGALPPSYEDGGGSLSQVLGLLVEHAAAAGPDERVTVSISGAGRDGAQQRVRFEVRDHAPPANRVALEHPEDSGGLSPALFRRLVARLGDELGGHRSALSGSTWWFVTCLRPVASAPARPRVLVADDSPVNRRIAAHLLCKLGCDVVTVDDGEQAVAAYREGGFHLILMDCQMPQMDGWEATAVIRRSEGRRHVPIVACTALSLQETRGACIESGMDDYVIKPLNSESLQRVLESWVGGMTVRLPPRARRPFTADGADSAYSAPPPAA